jgi:hypothetical protein
MQAQHWCSGLADGLQTGAHRRELMQRQEGEAARRGEGIRHSRLGRGPQDYALRGDPQPLQNRNWSGCRAAAGRT